MSERRECYLCGYPSDDYVIYRVPLASPKQEHPICSTCIEDLAHLMHEKDTKEAVG